MTTIYSLELQDAIPLYDSRNQVARILDYTQMIAVHQLDRCVNEGRFLVKLYMLSFSNDVLLLCLNEDQALGANDENTDQDLGANVLNADQYGNAKEQVPNEQDFGANEKNADEDGDATDEDGDTTDEDGNTTDEDEDITNEDGDVTDEDEDITNEDEDITNEDGDTTDEDEDTTDEEEDTTDQDEDATDQDEDATVDYVFCSTCKNKVALVDDLIKSARFGGVYNGVYNVEENNHHETIRGCTVASVYCDQCRTHLGGKLITVLEPDDYIREGRCLMKLQKLSYWNDEPLYRLDEEQDVGRNEENADQDGEAIDQDGDTTNQDGETTNQDGDTTNQYGDGNDEDTSEDGDSIDEDGDTSEEDFDANKENIDPNVQIADQDGDA